MANEKSFGPRMRVIHRYLGFFLIGIIAVYSLSGTVLIFRDTDFLKQEKQIVKQIRANAKKGEIMQLLNIRQLRIRKEEGTIIYFEAGQYNKNTGLAEYTVKALPFFLDKITHFHKAKSQDPLFFFNIFFALALLFFAVSSFWMFMPKTAIFKKGMCFTLGGIILTLILLFI